jgi:DNA-binding transcriptional MerR regulator
VKTIRQLAAQFGLSRSTLLYYDRLGLLRPDYRTSAGHRLYSEADEARLARICELRAAGMPLGEIDAVLEPSEKLRAPIGDALNRRLSDLNREIATLRRQQQVALALLRDRSAHSRSRVMTKERWVQLLAACGLDEQDRGKWHREFEKLSPEAHQDFLESLGLPTDEIATIRCWSAGGTVPTESAGTPAPATGSARTKRQRARSDRQRQQSAP